MDRCGVTEADRVTCTAPLLKTAPHRGHTWPNHWTDFAKVNRLVDPPQVGFNY
jgi:hypothetical protein